MHRCSSASAVCSEAAHPRRGLQYLKCKLRNRNDTVLISDFMPISSSSYCVSVPVDMHGVSSCMLPTHSSYSRAYSLILDDTFTPWNPSMFFQHFAGKYPVLPCSPFSSCNTVMDSLYPLGASQLTHSRSCLPLHFDLPVVTAACDDRPYIYFPMHSLKLNSKRPSTKPNETLPV